MSRPISAATGHSHSRDIEPKETLTRNARAVLAVVDIRSQDRYSLMQRLGGLLTLFEIIDACNLLWRRGLVLLTPSNEYFTTELGREVLERVS